MSYHKNIITILILFIVLSCNEEKEKTKPTRESITESIYASGSVKSKNQYQVYATVNGLIERIYVKEGDTVNIGNPIISISSETQKLNKENAELAAAFTDLKANAGKLEEAKLAVQLAKSKLNLDSTLYFRQATLYKQQVGSKADLEQRELAWQNAKNVYLSAIVKQQDLKKQLDFNAAQSQKNLLISQKLVGDFTVKSEINGIVYSINKTKGEIVSAQMPLAIIGDAKNFIIELQVDEYDILKLQTNLLVLVTLDSYKDKVFEAKISRIYPFMNERSKTFLVEAEFLEQPKILYPNITLEANIILTTKEKALLIPRNYLLNDSTVLDVNRKEVLIKTGLKDFQKVEVLSGIDENTTLIKPGK